MPAVTETMATLDQIPLGKSCRVSKLGGLPGLTQRLMEFGLFEGDLVKVIAVAPLGDPIEIETTYSRLSIRKVDAAQIEVIPS